MYLNDLQIRVYFLRERSLDRALEKSRLAHERKASTTTAPRPRRLSLASRSRREG